MKKTAILYWIFTTIWIASCSNKAIVSKPPGRTSQLRVLGYLHSPHDWLAGVNAVDLNSITDLNLAFINPDTTGNFLANDVYFQVIKKAHSRNIRVFISVGGGNPPLHLERLLEKDKRAGFITGLVAFAETYGFDGVDVDLENSLINHNYASFVSELSVALKPGKKLMTAALASWNAGLIHDSTLALYDFINIMSYDKTGPWNPSKPGQHSPFSMTENDFTYFNQTRSIAAEKLLIGLPFYGYGFGGNAPQSMNYKDIVNTYPGSEITDSVSIAGGGTLYYNGIPTIKQKVSFAASNKAGGVMIWQLLGDSNDRRSLLRAINEIKNY